MKRLVSTENASCELAKYNAQVEICKLISLKITVVNTESDDASTSEKDLMDKLNLYRNEFYMFLTFTAYGEVAFELNEFIKVERRTKTRDGTIWYLVSIQKDIANNFKKLIENYVEDYIKSYIEIESLEDKDDFLKALNMMDRALKN